MQCPRAKTIRDPSILFRVFAAFVLLASPLRAQEWRNLQPLPLARSDSAVAVFGNRIYLLGGCDADQVCIKGSGDMPGYCQCESSTDTVFVFDAATETYSTAPQMPIPRYRHDACAVGTKLWLFGGRTMPDASSGYDSIITQVDTFDTVTGEWTANVATYPGDLGSDNSCSTLNGAIYLAGGYSNAYDVSYGTTYRFDPGTSTFTRLNGRMLQGRGDFSSAASPGGVLRVWGGYSNASSDLASSWACLPLATSEVYDPVADAWSAGPPLPMALADHGDGIIINGTIYSVGGETKKRPVGCDYYDLVAVSDVLALNASATAWGRVTPLPVPRMRSTSAGVNSTIYLFGGQSAFVNGTTLGFFPLAYSAYALVVSATLSALPSLSASTPPSPSLSSSASPAASSSLPSASPATSFSPSASPSNAATPSVSPSATAAGLLFRSLPRMDLVGSPVGAAAFYSTAGEAACRSACLATPGCDAYAFSAGVLAAFAANQGQPGDTAPCYLYTNVTALIPSSPMTAGVLLARYS
jgi:N-acetylneuraminic acid mutarotase